MSGKRIILDTIPETLSRIFNKMSSEGLIRVQVSDIHLLDWMALEDLALSGRWSEEHGSGSLLRLWEFYIFSYCDILLQIPHSICNLIFRALKIFNYVQIFQSEYSKSRRHQNENRINSYRKTFCSGC